MTAKPLPKEIVDKIRREAHGGKSKYQVTKELDVSTSTVHNYT
jgi:hypothetical protein